MSHCAKCHRVPVKGCLLNCHNFFNSEYHGRYCGAGRFIADFLDFEGVDVSIRGEIGKRTVMEGERSRKTTVDSDLYRALSYIIMG